jgi:hypothetical protein
MVDPSKRAIVNVTLPSHMLFPGLIVVAVVEDQCTTWVDVTGHGRGNWAALNARFGAKLFASNISGIPKAMAGR